MMTRMQNLDDVTDVELAKSARKDEASSGGTAAAQPSASGGTAPADEDVTDCVGSTRITQFDLLVVFGGSPLASAGGTGEAGAATPSSTTQNAANAQSAVSTANGASAAAGGTGGTP
jgi:hypothetical protein